MIAIFGAAAAYGLTWMARGLPPAFWPVWMFSGFALAFALSWRWPRSWWVVASSVPAAVLLDILSSLRGPGSTAAALALGFGLFWSALAVLGACLGFGLSAAARRGSR